jgi:hypothetical protein
MRYNIIKKPLNFLDNKAAKYYFEHKRIAPSFFHLAGYLPEASSVNVDFSSGLDGVFTREVTECVIVGLIHKNKSTKKITRITMMHQSGGLSFEGILINIDHLIYNNLFDKDNEILKLYILMTNGSTPKYRLEDNMDEIYTSRYKDSFEKEIEFYESILTVSYNGYCLLRVDDNEIMAAEFNKSFDTNNYFVSITCLHNKTRKFNTTSDLYQYLKPDKYWIKKSKDITNCMICNSSFFYAPLNILYKARHHCRICGIIVCKNCIKFKKIQKSLFKDDIIEKENNYKVCIRH